jgi:hypothetical protein
MSKTDVLPTLGFVASRNCGEICLGTWESLPQRRKIETNYLGFLKLGGFVHTQYLGPHEAN